MKTVKCCSLLTPRVKGDGHPSHLPRFDVVEGKDVGSLTTAFPPFMIALGPLGFVLACWGIACIVI